MKKFILFMLMLCSFINLNAQHSIKGKVLIENSDSVEAVVKLYTKDNAAVSEMQTRKGLFSFQNIMKNKDYYVVASHVGFTTDTIKIEHIKKDLNLGTMFLKSSSIALGEIDVVGSRISFINGSKRIFPNEFQRKNSTDAMIMLDKMNLSRINVDPLAKSLTLNDGGTVKVLLNGREASVAEISALSPDVIWCIEYHDTPEVRYGNADIVLDFITKDDSSIGNFDHWRELQSAVH